MSRAAQHDIHMALIEAFGLPKATVWYTIHSPLDGLISVTCEYIANIDQIETGKAVEVIRKIGKFTLVPHSGESSGDENVTYLDWAEATK